MMNASPAHRSLLFPTLFWKVFLPWYFLEMPQRIIASYIQYAKAMWDIFAIFFLLRTLLKPWKNIIDQYPSRGLNIGEIAQVFTLNTTTRVIGAIIRLSAIAAGIVFQALLIVVFAACFVAWVVFPILFFVIVSASIRFLF